MSDAESPTLRTSEDILAILCAGVLLMLSLILTWTSLKLDVPERSKAAETNVGKKTDSNENPNAELDKEENPQAIWTAKNPLAKYVGKPAKWKQSPIHSFSKLTKQGQRDNGTIWKWVGAFLLLCVTLTVGLAFNEGFRSAVQFLPGFISVFLLATIAYVFAANEVVKAYNLEYALWALVIGMLVANTYGVPTWLKPAIRTEFYIKTGLVLLGAGVLVSKLLALGIPGVFVAWVVTPIVLITTYWFGQKVLKMESRSLNMVISADMSVCGVSAAIAAAAACKAKKEELSLAIGLSLSFTVIMMAVLPLVIRWIGLNETIGGAWLGGTIDSTGARCGGRCHFG